MPGKNCKIDRFSPRMATPNANTIKIIAAILCFESRSLAKKELVSFFFGNVVFSAKLELTTCIHLDGVKKTQPSDGPPNLVK